MRKTFMGAVLALAALAAMSFGPSGPAYAAPSTIIVQSDGITPVDTSNPFFVRCVTGCASATNTVGTQGTITAADVATTSTPGQSGVNAITGAPTANSAVTYTLSTAASGGTLTISGTFVATCQVEASYDSAVHYTASSALLRGTSTLTSSITGPGAFSVDLNGVTSLRVRCTAYTSGTVTVDFTYSGSPGLTKLLNPLPTGTNSVGKVGGLSFFVATTPTIQNASYASGNCMGGFQAVAASATTGATGTLHAMSIASKGGATTALQVYVFSANPAASTCTDKSTFTINTADVSKLITSFTLTPAAVTGTTVTYADNTSMGRPFATSGNGNIYLAIVAGGTFTPASTTDLVITAGGYVDAP